MATSSPYDMQGRESCYPNEASQWRIYLPVILKIQNRFASGGHLGKVGDLRIDAQTGDLEVAAPQTLTQLANHAEVLMSHSPATDLDSYWRTVA
jgi:hypothetical protein